MTDSRTTLLAIPMYCRQCGHGQREAFSRQPHDSASDRQSIPHRYRCARCGGTLDPTQEGLTILARHSPIG